jgi:hypothetical protein
MTSLYRSPSFALIADFSGGEAEELRRAMGMRRSKDKMLRLKEKLTVGMTRKGVSAEAQTLILQAILSFALYGFPESHAARQFPFWRTGPDGFPSAGPILRKAECHGRDQLELVLAAVVA